MKFAIALATLVVSLVSTQAFAKPPENPGKGKSPVTQPGPDIVIDLSTPASINANFHSPVSNVPEPESAALAAAGLAMVGWLAWRRRK